MGRTPRRITIPVEEGIVDKEYIGYRTFDEPYLKNGNWPLDKARELANISLEHITKIADAFCETHEDKEDEIIRELLEDVSYNIMKIAVKQEI